jgi:cytochrome c heme-lyase
MFYNALQRKNKAEGVTEEDAETMVYVHNTMNENTWRQVLHWEKLHHQECADPRLHWFVGRPHDLSPKAKLWSFFGWDKPFDRHDWVVDRCGKSVRYVIDFYSREASTNTTGNPSAFPTSSLYADVRPALDSFESFFDRVKHLFKSFGSKTGNEFAYNKPSPVAKSPNKIEDRDYTTEKRSLPIAVATTERIREKCHKYTEALLACRDEKEYESARTKVDLCVGRAVCPNEVKTFEESLQTSTPEDLEKGYRNILKCVTSFNVWLSESLALAQPPQSSDKKPPPS